MASRMKVNKGRMLRAAALAALPALAGSAAGADTTWLGGTGNWGDSAKWSPADVPDTAAENAVVNAGQVTLDQSFSIGNLTLGMATIGGSNDLTISGIFNWNGGLFAGPGKVIANGGINIGGGAGRSIVDGRTLINNATATWTGGDITFSNNALIQNVGTFDISVTANLSKSGTNAVGAFNNAGLLLKSNGPTLISPVFNSTGTVRVTNGDLGIGGGGSASGRFELLSDASRLLFLSPYQLTASSNISGSGSAVFAAGTVHSEGTYNLSGTTWALGGRGEIAGSNAANLGALLRVSGGSIAIDAPTAAAGSLDQSAGTIEGSGTLTISGPASWSGGAQAGTGSTVAAGGIDLKGGGKALGGARTLRIAAASSGTWSAGDLTLSGGAVFANDGTLTNTYDGSVLLDGTGGGAPRFRNTGTFVKSSSTGTTTFNVPFDNSGTVRVSSGVVRLAAGGSSTGRFDINEGGLELLGGYVLGAGTVISGSNFVSIVGDVSVAAGATATASNVIHSAGNLGGAGTLTAETFGWTGGLQSGGGLTDATVSLSLAGGQKILGGRRLRVAPGASASWSGGDIVFDAGGILENDTTLNNTFNGNMFLVPGAAGAGVQNAGVFDKVGGTGLTSIGVPFHNSGTVRISTGQLALLGAGVGTGNFDLAGGPLQLGGGYTLGPGATFSGTNLLRIVGDVNVSGSVVARVAEQVDGTLGGAGSLTLDEFTWTAGTQGGSGTTLATASLKLQGLNLFMEGRTLAGGSAATTIWSSPKIFAGNGARLVNSGTFITTFDGEMVHHVGALPSFDNLGELRKDAPGTGTTSIGIPFNNSGVARVNSGVLRLSNGGAGAGKFEIAAGSVLDLADGYSLGDGGSIGGPGEARLTFGPLTVPGGKATVRSLEQTGGSMEGAGELAVEKLVWTGGSLGGGGTTTVSQSLEFSGIGLGMTGRTLKIAEGATAAWNGGEVRLSGGGGIDNFGTFTIADDVLYTRIDGSSPRFRNLGTLLKSGGTNVSTFSGVLLDNPGVMEISAGTLSTAVTQFDEATRTLTGGTWRIKSPGAFDLISLGGVASNLASITLDGPNANFARLADLAVNKGSLELKNGKHLAFGPMVNNSGTIRADATSAIAFGDQLANSGQFDSAGATSAKTITNTGSFMQGGAMTVHTLFENGGTGTADLAGGTIWDDGARLAASGGSVIVRQDTGAAVGPKVTLDARGGLIDSRASQHLGGLTLGAGKVKIEAGGARVLRAKAYSAQQTAGNWAGQLDLADAKAILEYSDASPAATVRSQLRSGYAGGPTAWSGNGIVSSAAAADPSLALGYGESAQLLGPAGGTFAGETVGDKAVLIALTKFGDANLDGAVSFGDFQRLEAGFGKEGFWNTGDFDYSGTVDFADFKLLYDHFGQTMGAPGAAAAPAITAAEWSALDAFAAANAVQTPEPGGLALLSLLAGLCSKRRRR
jgi:hypothetical protein